MLLWDDPLSLQATQITVIVLVTSKPLVLVGITNDVFSSYIIGIMAAIGELPSLNLNMATYLSTYLHSNIAASAAIMAPIQL